MGSDRGPLDGWSYHGVEGNLAFVGLVGVLMSVG